VLLLAQYNFYITAPPQLRTYIPEWSVYVFIGVRRECGMDVNNMCNVITEKVYNILYTRI